VAVARGHGQHLGGDVFGQAVGELLAFGVQHLGDASDLRCSKMTALRPLGKGLEFSVKKEFQADRLASKRNIQILILPA